MANWLENLAKPLEDKAKQLLKTPSDTKVKASGSAGASIKKLPSVGAPAVNVPKMPFQPGFAEQQTEAFKKGSNELINNAQQNLNNLGKSIQTTVKPVIDYSIAPAAKYTGAVAAAPFQAVTKLGEAINNNVEKPIGNFIEQIPGYKETKSAIWEGARLAPDVTTKFLDTLNSVGAFNTTDELTGLIPGVKAFKKLTAEANTRVAEAVSTIDWSNVPFIGTAAKEVAKAGLLGMGYYVDFIERPLRKTVLPQYLYGLSVLGKFAQTPTSITEKDLKDSRDWAEYMSGGSVDGASEAAKFMAKNFIQTIYPPAFQSNIDHEEIASLLDYMSGTETRYRADKAKEIAADWTKRTGHEVTPEQVRSGFEAQTIWPIWDTAVSYSASLVEAYIGGALQNPELGNAANAVGGVMEKISKAVYPSTVAVAGLDTALSMGLLTPGDQRGLAERIDANNLDLEQTVSVMRGMAVLGTVIKGAGLVFKKGKVSLDMLDIGKAADGLKKSQAAWGKDPATVKAALDDFGKRYVKIAQDITKGNLTTTDINKIARIIDSLPPEAQTFMKTINLQLYYKNLFDGMVGGFAQPTLGNIKLDVDTARTKIGGGMLEADRTIPHEMGHMMQSFVLGDPALKAEWETLTKNQDWQGHVMGTTADASYKYASPQEYFAEGVSQFIKTPQVLKAEDEGLYNFMQNALPKFNELFQAPKFAPEAAMGRIQTEKLNEAIKIAISKAEGDVLKTSEDSIQAFKDRLGETGNISKEMADILANPKNLDEDGQLTPEGSKAYSIAEDKYARAEVGATRPKNLSDLDKLPPTKKREVVKSILDVLGIQYTEPYSASSSKYLGVLNSNTGEYDIIRFSDHTKTARGMGHDQVHLNIVDGKDDLNSVVEYISSIGQSSARLQHVVLTDTPELRTAHGVPMNMVEFAKPIKDYQSSGDYLKALRAGEVPALTEMQKLYRAVSVDDLFRKLEEESGSKFGDIESFFDKVKLKPIEVQMTGDIKLPEGYQGLGDLALRYDSLDSFKQALLKDYEAVQKLPEDVKGTMSQEVIRKAIDFSYKNNTPLDDAKIEEIWNSVRGGQMPRVGTKISKELSTVLSDGNVKRVIREIERYPTKKAFVEAVQEAYLNRFDTDTLADIQSRRHELHSTDTKSLVLTESGDANNLQNYGNEIADAIEGLLITGNEGKVADEIRNILQTDYKNDSDFEYDEKLSKLRDLDDANGTHKASKYIDDYLYEGEQEVFDLKEKLNTIVENYLGEVDEKWDALQLDDVSDARGGETFKPSGFARARSVLGDGPNNTARNTYYNSYIDQLKDFYKSHSVRVKKGGGEGAFLPRLSDFFEPKLSGEDAVKAEQFVNKLENKYTHDANTPNLVEELMSKTDDDLRVWMDSRLKEGGFLAKDKEGKYIVSYDEMEDHLVNYLNFVQRFKEKGEAMPRMAKQTNIFGESPEAIQKQAEKYKAESPKINKVNVSWFGDMSNKSEEDDFYLQSLAFIDYLNRLPPGVRGGIVPPEFDFKTWNDKSTFALSRETIDRNMQDIAGADYEKVKAFLIDPIRKNETNRTEYVNAEILAAKRKVVNELGVKVDSVEDKMVMKYGEGRITLAALKTELPQTWKNVVQAAQYFKDRYNILLTDVNKARIKFGYDPIPRRTDYFRHFQEMDAVVRILGQEKLPTEINGLTMMFKPGKPFSTAELHRIGGDFTESAIKGFENYLESVPRQAFHIDSVQRVRALESYIRTSVPEQSKELSNVVANLRRYGNTLAGKKADLDRAAESVVGREVFGAMDWLSKQTGANMIGGNISSALTNFIPFTQLLATTPKTDVLKGSFSTALTPIKGNFGEIEGIKSDFLVRRFPEKYIDPTWLQNASQTVGTLFETIDRFTARSVVASKFYELQEKGIEPEVAIKMADDYAGKVLADRSFGQLPDIMSTKTLKPFTQFQVEVNNMVSFITKDIPNFSKGDKLKLGSQLGQLFLYSYLINNLYEKVVGRRPTLDPVQTILQTLGMTQDTERLEFGERVLKAAGDFKENLPFIGGFTGGRFPLSAGFPDIPKILMAKDEDRGGVAFDETFKTITTLALPFGGSQVKKTYEGLTDYNKGYSESRTGRVRYVIEKDLWNLIRMGLFGKYSAPEARQYYDYKRSTLGEKQSATYKEMVQSVGKGLADKYYWEVIGKRKKERL